jgi:FtsP/CotA-like multicopper oxidase with cupredoxin domain
MPTRRELLLGGLGAGAGLAVGCHRGRSPMPAAGAAAPSDPDVEAVLRAAPAEVVLDPAARQATRVWRYEGRLVRGPAGSLTSSGGYLGPTLRVRPGQRVRVRFENGLGEASLVHWHGLDVAQENDGHPRFAVAPGGARVYDFEVTDRPATYWYHPHPHERTAPQVYFGLAGLFIVSDGQDEARGLPGPAFELPLVLQDRVLDSDGQLVYQPNPMTGLLGDQVFVNGRPEPSFEVRKGTYRLRVLNGSNARIYKLAWSDGSPMVVIGSDGGLLAAPVSRPYLMLAPGERAELWADFGRGPGGAEVALESRSFSEGGPGGMGMMGGAGTSNGAALHVCRFSVRGAGERRALPEHLETPAFRPLEEVANAGDPRRFQVSMGMMRWLLNGRPFSMMEVAANERIKRGVTEHWEFSNFAGMMALPHPIHLHGGQFQVVARAGAAAGVTEGRVEEGWKDTVLLMPGERVRLRVRFARHEGLFLYHCHNLEHEDMGMMRNFRVEA